jgi:hypothetical protein
MRQRTASALAYASLLCTGALGAQEPAPRKLALIAKYDDDFASVSRIRELPDGRILVSDPKEPTVYLIDLVTKNKVRLGRQGTGPGEYRRPGGLYAAPADSTFVLDRGQPRYIVVDPAGKIIESRPIRAGGGRSFTDDDVDLQKLDGRGRVYADSRGGSGGLFAMARTRGVAGGMIDSMPLMRLDPATRTYRDTLGWLRIPAMRVSGANGPITPTSTMFAPADDWGVAPDGRVALVRAHPYRVQWLELDNRVINGPVVETLRIRVTEDDKREVRRAIGDSGAVLSTRTTGTAQARSQKLPEMTFAEFKPPFELGGVSVSPDARVWVKRVTATATRDVIYDVFDQKGTRVDRVQLPPRHHIVGFGRRAVYAVELDDDDVPHIRKFTL